jgi:hypothetical protein
MADPVSIIIGVDALANTAAKIYVAVRKTLPYSRMTAWKEAGTAIAEVSLDNQLKMPENRLPTFLTLYARWEAYLFRVVAIADLPVPM